MFLRSVLAIMVVIASLASPAAADDDRFIFRWKAGLNSGTVEPVDPGGPGDPEDPEEAWKEAIHARFVAIVGEEFSEPIPVRPGTVVAEWRIAAGTLPEGISFDDTAGRFGGIPEAVGGRGGLRFTGHDRTGAERAKAVVSFDVLGARSNTFGFNAYAHTGKFFSKPLPNYGGVYEWEALVPMPEGIEASPAFVEGRPAEAGHYGIALLGRNFLGEEVAFLKGAIIVEDGPVIGLIPDIEQHPTELFEIWPHVQRTVGDLKWELLGDPLPHNLRFSTGTSGAIFGYIRTFSTKGTFRLKAIDEDGAWGVSNPFTLSTIGPVLDLHDARDMILYVGEDRGFGFRADELTGIQTWTLDAGVLPEGLTLDPVTGYVSGAPARVEVQEGIVVSVASSDGGTDATAPFSIEVREQPIKVKNPEDEEDDEDGEDDVTDPRLGRAGGLHVRINEHFATAELEVTGAVAPWTFSLAQGGEMPEGLTLDPGTGTVSGSVPIAGPHSVPVVVTDADGAQSGVITVGITAYNPLSVTVDSGTYGIARHGRARIVATPGDRSVMPSGSETFSLVGTLPQGLSFDSGLGRIVGEPLVEGVFGPYRIAIQDGSGDTALSSAFSVEVGPREDLRVTVGDTEIAQYVEVGVKVVESTGAIDGVTYELVEGTLPAGLEFHGDGYVTGTTWQGGEFPGIRVKATDGDGAIGFSTAFTLVVVAPENIRVSNVSHDWLTGRMFTTPAPGVTNAIGDYTFALVEPGSLPAGLSFEPETGTVYGTASVPAEHAFAITVTDEAGRSDGGEIRLRIRPPMTMEHDSLYRVARLGSANFTPRVSNAFGRVTYSQTGVLPDGMEFNSANGSISGTPTAEGMFGGLKVMARDEAGTLAESDFAIEVYERADLVVDYSFPSKLIRGTATGLPVMPVKPDNAIGEVTYSLEGDLPPGMNFNTATGAFGGQPTEIGTWTGIFVTGTDEDGFFDVSDEIVIEVGLTGSIAIGDLNRKVREGAFFTTPSLAPSNVAAPVSFRPRSGPLLPFDLDLDPLTGAVAGSIGTEGSHVLALTVEDSLGRTRDFNIVMEVVGPLSITVPASTETNQYARLRVVPEVANAIGTVSYTLSGDLPNGAEFHAASGMISGDPTQKGTFDNLRITATDADGSSTTSSPFIVTVGDRLPLSVTLPSATDAVADRNFKLTALARNVVGDATYSLVAGTLPPGIGLNEATGRIEGIPSGSAVAYPGIVVRVEDSTGESAQTDPLTITVTHYGGPIILLLTDITVKTGMDFITAVPVVQHAVGDIAFGSNDVAAYGLTLDTATGRVSGNVSQPTRIEAHINVYDSTERLTSEPIIITVLAPLQVTYRSQMETEYNTFFEEQVARPVVRNAVGSVTYEMLGDWPEGLSIRASDGYISGRPLEIGAFTDLAVRATDELGDTQVSNAFTLVVEPRSTPPTVSVTNSTMYFGVIAESNYSFSYNTSNPFHSISLNKPLPAGLSIDLENRQIVGQASADEIGVHGGYVLTVTDAAGLSGDSQTFEILVRGAQSFTNTIVAPPRLEIRLGQPFEHPGPTWDSSLAVGEVEIGNVNPSTVTYYPDENVFRGVLYDHVYGVSMTVGDRIGSRSTSIPVTVRNLRVDYPDESSRTYEAGDPFLSSMPQTFYAGPGGRYEIVSGPESVNIDPATGQLSGTLPDGQTLVRVRFTDDYGYAESNEYLKAVDTKPDAFVLPDVTGAVPGQTYESDFVVISGLPSAARLTMTVTGSGFSHMICTATSCNGTWRSTATLDGVRATYRLKFRLTAPAAGQTRTIGIKVGGYETTWSVTSAL